MDLDLRLKKLGIMSVVGEIFHPMKAEELAEIENNLAVRLPETYRTFLVSYGASSFRNIIGFHPLSPLPPYLSSNGDAMFSYFYGGSETRHETHTLFWNISVYRSRMPLTMIPIGNDGGDNQICLGISGPEAGKVYYWDHENECDEEDYREQGLPVPLDLKFQNVHLIADSFEDFIARLYVAEAGE